MGRKANKRAATAEPPILEASPADILDGGPHDLDELPAYFARLNKDQLRSAWVSLIADAVSEGLYFVPGDPAPRCRVSLSALIRALNAARARL